MVKPGQIDVIKQGKRPPEEFNPDKLHNSIIATCLSVRTPEGQAQDIAKTVTLGVMNWCETHPEITSADIRRQAQRIIKTLHPDAAYLYKNYKTII